MTDFLPGYGLFNYRCASQLISNVNTPVYSATVGIGEVGLFYWQTDQAPCNVCTNLHLILLIALKCQVTSSLIITHFPKLLIKIQETITFHRLAAVRAKACGADNYVFFRWFLPTPYSFWRVCLSVCRRSGGVSLPCLPGTSSRKAFMLQGMLLSAKQTNNV